MCVVDKIPVLQLSNALRAIYSLLLSRDGKQTKPPTTTCDLFHGGTWPRRAMLAWCSRPFFCRTARCSLLCFPAAAFFALFLSSFSAVHVHENVVELQYARISGNFIDGNIIRHIRQGLRLCTHLMVPSARLVRSGISVECTCMYNIWYLDEKSNIARWVTPKFTPAPRNTLKMP